TFKWHLRLWLVERDDIEDGGHLMQKNKRQQSLNHFPRRHHHRLHPTVGRLQLTHCKPPGRRLGAIVDFGFAPHSIEHLRPKCNSVTHTFSQLGDINVYVETTDSLSLSLSLSLFLSLPRYQSGTADLSPSALEYIVTKEREGERERDARRHGAK